MIISWRVCKNRFLKDRGINCSFCGTHSLSQICTEAISIKTKNCWYLSLIKRNIIRGSRLQMSRKIQSLIRTDFIHLICCVWSGSFQLQYPQFKFQPSHMWKGLWLGTLYRQGEWAIKILWYSSLDARLL